MSNRKRKRTLQEESEEMPKIAFELPDFSFGSLSDTKVNNNHIYFYEEVTQKSALNLNTKLREVEQQLVDRNHKHKFHEEYIYLHMCSMGGCVFSAFSIIDTIKNLQVPVVSIIEGNAASAATLISVVCDYRLCHSNSFMLIHELSTGMWGKLSEIELEVENSTNLMKRIKAIYKDNTNLTERDLNSMLNEDRWWGSKDSKRMGLVDEIVKSHKRYKFDRNKLSI